jgi:glutaminase
MFFFNSAHHNDRHDTLSVLQKHGSTLSMLERASAPETRLLQHFKTVAGSLHHDKSMSIPVSRLLSYLKKKGLNPGIPNTITCTPLQKEIDTLTDGTDFITWKSFESSARHPTPEGILERAVTDRLVIRNWSKFTAEIEEMYHEVKKIDTGKVATYIPELGKVNPDLFGVSICTIDGQVFNIGDTEVAFPIQSCGKPVIYSAALEQGSNIDVHSYVGREPSGVSFNAFTLNSEDKPHNACINAGAIIVSALYYPQLNPADRFNMLSDKLSDLTGDEKPGFGLSVFLSEKQTAHANFALAHFMAAKGRFPQDVSIENALDFYFQMCSTELNCRQMAVLAGTYAHNGRNPITKKTVFSPETVKNTVSMLFSCGMYNYSGEWACTVGLPAKSGVSGVIFLVVPGILGVSIFSPPLDGYGNSAKGVEFAKRLADKYKYGLFDVLYKADHNGAQTNSNSRSASPRP